MKEIIEKLAKFENLSGVEMTDVIERIVTGRVTEAQIASLLLALKMKGETPEERTAIAQVMRGHAQHIPTEIHDAMDNCGTGGDKSFSFNISTTAAFVLAGGGVHMAKHGNRSISSKSGSADVLEALGINLDLKPAELGKVFDKTGIVFLFAKKYAPSHEIHHASSFGIGNSNDHELDWSTDSPNGLGNTASWD